MYIFYSLSAPKTNASFSPSVNIRITAHTKKEFRASKLIVYIYKWLQSLIHQTLQFLKWFVLKMWTGTGSSHSEDMLN
jgi:hypothetical protein